MWFTPHRQKELLMSRRSKSAQTEAAAQAAIDAAEDHEDYDLGAAMDFAADTLTGDMRDMFLAMLRFDQDKRPWCDRPEAKQREIIHHVDEHCRDIVTQAVTIIAAHGRRTIKAQIEQITVKDGIKAVLSLSKFDQNRHNLIDAQGSTVLIVIADAEQFVGERAEVPIKPDQPILALALHSDPED
jgi:hypothetical protein